MRRTESFRGGVYRPELEKCSSAMRVTGMTWTSGRMRSCKRWWRAWVWKRGSQHNGPEIKTIRCPHRQAISGGGSCSPPRYLDTWRGARGSTLTSFSGISNHRAVSHLTPHPPPPAPSDSTTPGTATCGFFTATQTCCTRGWAPSTEAAMRQDGLNRSSIPDAACGVCAPTCRPTCSRWSPRGDPRAPRCASPR